jgi:hypothetical protein
MPNWWNTELIKYQVDEILSWWNADLRKCQVEEMPS